ncbi:MAG TPA: hypothetical protein VKT70_08520 [Stellaceae bacterium]|nr:hypothetical protein [Stellaceae bacterium]
MTAAIKEKFETTRELSLDELEAVSGGRGFKGHFCKCGCGGAETSSDGGQTWKCHM